MARMFKPPKSAPRPEMCIRDRVAAIQAAEGMDDDTP